MSMVTMKNIADEVGVSRPAVSLVLNSRDSNARISASTKEEILSAAKRLGYRMNFQLPDTGIWIIRKSHVLH